MATRAALEGRRFGRLTVIKFDGHARDKKALWLCMCDCGREHHAVTNKLTRGEVTSCGCFLKEERGSFRRTHGMSTTPEFKAWSLMKARCTRVTAKDYVRYGGRGIRVCDRWMQSFTAFLEDVGMRPSKHHSLGRIDNNGNYEPGNVRWETVAQQARNTRRNDLITHDGKTLTISEWAQLAGLKDATLRRRLKVHKWQFEKAISAATRKLSERDLEFIRSSNDTSTSLALRFGVSSAAIRRARRRMARAALGMEAA